MTPEILQLFKETPGAISIGEGLAIQWLITQIASEGICLDIGTNAGKAAICQASGLSQGGVVRHLACIDMVFDLTNEAAWKDHRSHSGPEVTGWEWIYEKEFLRDVRHRIEFAGGGSVAVALFGESAITAIPRLGKSGVGWAFCDADSNQDWLVNGIVDLLAPLMVKGGIIAHHDFESQFIAPREAQERLLASGRFERVVIPWDELQKQVDALGGEHEGNRSWHHRETPRPMFVGAIRKL